MVQFIVERYSSDGYTASSFPFHRFFRISDNPDSTASAAAAARAFLSNLRALTDKAELALEALEEDKA